MKIQYLSSDAVQNCTTKIIQYYFQSNQQHLEKLLLNQTFKVHCNKEFHSGMDYGKLRSPAGCHWSSYILPAVLNLVLERSYGNKSCPWGVQVPPFTPIPEGRAIPRPHKQTDLFLAQNACLFGIHAVIYLFTPRSTQMYLPKIFWSSKRLNRNPDNN